MYIWTSGQQLAHTQPQDPKKATTSPAGLPLEKVGCLLQKRVSRQGQTASDDRSTAGIEVWEEADPCSFLVRGLNYAKDGKKFNSKGAIYRHTPPAWAGTTAAGHMQGCLVQYAAGR